MLTAPLLVPPRKPQPEPKREKEAKKPTIKKPLNAFMLYMKEMRAKVIAECTLKESAAINQILGRRVRARRAQRHRPRAASLSLAAALDHVASICFQTWVLLALKHAERALERGGRGGVGWEGTAGPRLIITLVLAVACAVPGGTGQVLRTGSQGTAAPHAALPRLVCQRQLREWLL